MSLTSGAVRLGTAHRPGYILSSLPAHRRAEAAQLKIHAAKSELSTPSMVVDAVAIQSFSVG